MMRGRGIGRFCVCLVCLFAAGCTLLGGGLVPQSTQPVIKIGLVAPFERRYRTLGYEVLYAAKWAVQERNARGGVAGTMVELVALNDGDDPAESAFQADKLAVDPDVVAVIGPFTDATLVAAAPTYSALDLAMITPATCPPSIDGQSGVFCFGMRARDLAQEMHQRLPVEARVFLLRMSGDPLAAVLAPMAERVIDVPVDDAAWPDLAGRPPDTWLYGGDVLGAADLLRQMRHAGIDVPLWGGPSLARTQLPQIAGEAVANACYAITAPLYADLSANSPFIVGYRELSGAVPGLWAALTYDVASLLLDAMEWEIQVRGHATREGVHAYLGQSVGPDGQPIFVEGLRGQAEADFYCYDVGEPYPGHASTLGLPE